jgi:hypothetical protein
MDGYDYGYGYPTHTIYEEHNTKAVRHMQNAARIEITGRT